MNTLLVPLENKKYLSLALYAYIAIDHKLGIINIMKYPEMMRNFNVIKTLYA